MAEVNEKNRAELASAPADVKNESVTGSDYTGEHNGINEKALLRKLDLRLLPPLTILYLLSFLDRSNGMILMAKI